MKKYYIPPPGMVGYDWIIDYFGVEDYMIRRMVSAGFLIKPVRVGGVFKAWNQKEIEKKYPRDAFRVPYGAIRRKEFSEKLGVSLKTMYRYIGEGILPKPKKTITGMAYWIEEEVKCYYKWELCK